MHLNAEQVAAAEAAGCTFLPVPEGALHRYAMQRKLFRVAGREMLATRGGGLFETVATLERLIDEGRGRIGVPPPAQAPAVAPARPPVQAAADPMPEEAAVSPVDAAPVEPAAAEAGSPAPEDPPPPVPVAAEPPETPRPRTRRPRAVKPPPAEEPRADAIGPAAGSTETGDPAVQAPRRRTRQPEAPRWSTAGATRRGRAGVHWSTRNR